MLKKDTVILSVLNSAHLAELTKLSQDEKLWEFAPEPYYLPEFFSKWCEKALRKIADKTRCCYVIFVKNKLAGSTSYYDIDLENKTLNIGYTWISTEYWGTNINLLSKYLLLEHAFEKLNFNRVGFSVDSLNIRSCKALLKMGIQQEGILRNHLILPSNRIRHSAIFSVIAAEWPALKQNLNTLLFAPPSAK